MRLFKDTRGREWRVEINVTQVKRVRALAGVDIFSVGDDFLVRFGGLLQDVVQLVDILFVLVMDQAKEAAVTDEDFGRALAGDVLHHATDAFAQELIDFFRDVETRQVLREYLARYRELGKAAMDAGRQRLRRLDVGKMVREAMGPNKALNGSPTTAPAASGLTPDR